MNCGCYPLYRLELVLNHCCEVPRRQSCLIVAWTLFACTRSTWRTMEYGLHSGVGNESEPLLQRCLSKGRYICITARWVALHLNLLASDQCWCWALAACLFIGSCTEEYHGEPTRKRRFALHALGYKKTGKPCNLVLVWLSRVDACPAWVTSLWWHWNMRLNWREWWNVL